MKTSPLSRAREGTPAGSPRGDTLVRPDVPVSPGGTVAGKYRIDSVIGFGGMGIVCEGFHLDLETRIEVQIARREHVNDERAVARILSQARSAAQLRSQHARRVLDCGRLDVGAPYMVVEHLDGADLRRVGAAHRGLPVGEVMSFVLQACEALGEAHSLGIVHGDLTPENLFLTHGPDGGALIKVLDLGVSQRIDPTAVDARTDIWSLGAILHELLTGKLPSEGKSVDAAIPEDLAAIVLRCIDKNRDARFPDATALGRALRQFGELTASVTAERVEEILRRARSSRPESETSQSVADMPASVVDAPESVIDMPASVVDVPDSVPAAPEPAAAKLPRSIPALPALPPSPPPLPVSQPASTVPQSEAAATESIPARRPSLGTKPPPLPPSHSPPPHVLGQLVEKHGARFAFVGDLLGKHGARFALVGVLIGLLFGLFASRRDGPASVPSSASAASKGVPVVEPAARVVEPARPVVEPAARVVEPARPVVEPDQPALLPSAAPVASPAPPPRAPTTAQEPASEPARLVAPPQKPASNATPAPAPTTRPASKRAWSPFPELKQPVLPPHVR